MVLKR